MVLAVSSIKHDTHNRTHTLSSLVHVNTKNSRKNEVRSHRDHYNGSDIHYYLISTHVHIRTQTHTHTSTHVHANTYTRICII